ncbi:MAG: class II aldolase/adducin family protein [Candidatus Aphodousia sp.]|nr:class II aldolase/adducin family protein [Sutterella sp.]MDY2899219.1 class II aldolase/adducin family protein [Candidatus Aphodousia sp.]
MPASVVKDLRVDVIESAVAMSRVGLCVNKSGNVSARARLNGVEGFWITPTGISYEELTPGDIVFVHLSEVLNFESEFNRLPSSEWAMHAEVYRHKPQVKAIVHTHSTYATALACCDMPIPAFHYMVAAAGGTEIPCAPYALFGSKALAESAICTLGQLKACLLSHHGVLTVGIDTKSALALAQEVESLAKTYTVVRALGAGTVLDNSQMAEVLERFKTYGQQK